MFDAILIGAPGEARLERLDEDRLPEGDVLVRVAFSTLNYKDGLAITGKGRVVRNYPMVPGIDLAGVVERSEHPDWKPGDRVVANGWGLGEAHWGGLAGKARVRGEWLIPLPAPFTLREAAAIGTAGYTAALCVLALERHGVRPEGGEVLVTGAAGGVGSVAVALLARRGFRTVAMTGRPAEEPYLRRLGAAAVIGRDGHGAPGKPLLSERWAGAVDVAGGAVLSNVLAATREEGAVAACGLAAGMELPATVAPFILRGVSLLGINCVTAPVARRLEAWSVLAEDLDRELLAGMVEEVALADAVAAAERLLAGGVRGRIVVPLGGEE